MTPTPSTLTLQKLNIAAYILNIVITFGGGVLGLFGGKTNTAVSHEYTTIVTPAGFAFGIWGIIFITEGIFTYWQALPAQANSPVVAAIGSSWIVACLFQSAWTFAFAYEQFWISLCLIVGIATALAQVYKSTHPANGVFPSSQDSATILVSKNTTTTGTKLNLIQWAICVLPFAIHFGWIIAASTVNANVAAVASGATIANQYTIAFGSLAFVALGVATLAWPKGDPIVGFVATWALTAIGLKLLKNTTGVMQQGANHTVTFATRDLTVVAYATFALAALNAIISLIFIIRAVMGVPNPSVGELVSTEEDCCSADAVEDEEEC